MQSGRYVISAEVDVVTDTPGLNHDEVVFRFDNGRVMVVGGVSTLFDMDWVEPEPSIGSVVLDDDGDAWQNDSDGWSLALRPVDSDAFDWSWVRLNEEYGPVKVVYTP